jgi:hypothetical protein
MINYYPNCIKLLFLFISCFIFIDCCCYRLKTWLRSKMGQDRLCGLAVLHIHREINTSVDDIINRFASIKKKILT